MLERAQAGDRVEGAERVGCDLPGVGDPRVQPVAAAGFGLGRRERHADALGLALADEVEQRAPAAPEVEHPATRRDADLLGDVLVLAALRLLQGQREVAVVLGAGEVGHLPEAEPKDPVDQGVGELEVALVGHLAGRYREATKRREGEDAMSSESISSSSIIEAAQQLGKDEFSRPDIAGQLGVDKSEIRAAFREARKLGKIEKTRDDENNTGSSGLPATSRGRQ